MTEEQLDLLLEYVGVSCYLASIHSSDTIQRRPIHEKIREISEELRRTLWDTQHEA